VAVTAIIIPGIGAYLIISIGTGEYLPILDFIAGIGILYLFSFYWLALTLMLGTFFNARGPVIGIPLALIFGQQFITGVIMAISPKIINFLPYPLIMPPQDGLGSVVQNVILGITPTSWIPVISSIVSTLIFLVVGIWRFRKQEF
jgi:ABC-type transport system involved in multi-copper enzyme maturation permease subunit